VVRGVGFGYEMDTQAGCRVVPGKATEHKAATIERMEEFSSATVGLTMIEGMAILSKYPPAKPGALFV